MIHSLEQAAGRPVSRETFQRLQFYVDRLKSEAQRQNLVSAASLEHLWERHILDSAQLVRFEPRAGVSWVDVGSGAGLPGIVIACLVEGPVTLVEPRRLRAEFLRATAEGLGLGVAVECAKIERITGVFDVITGRAVAPLAKFFEWSQHLSTEKTVWVLPKGQGAQSELAEATRAWQGVFHVEHSVTDADSRIVVGTGVRAKTR
ncbi:MAG TPA: 16S rRNA (guanine(527)-N(7))-methyltransferase RsmG [Sphingomicrobium sp.]|nr:16S rRNA (guanine(527)-N(7))-methyltransferase RsmG [Sphingomicrobium sp.]